MKKASIDLEKGFTVLTGETGAGKSIIIDAIHAVLGERTSKELVRTGTDSASVSALFTSLDEDTLSLLDRLSLPREEDGSLLIQRDIRLEGRSTCKINGAPATVSMLKQLGPRLVTIHGQHESYELLSPEVHMSTWTASPAWKACWRSTRQPTAPCGRPSGSWRPCRLTRGRRPASPTCSTIKSTR